MTKPKYPPIIEQEFLSALDKVTVRIIKQFSNDSFQRGYWEEMADSTSRLTIAWYPHRQHDFAFDMVNTLIHETCHHLRPDASEGWIRKHTGHLYTIDKIRAASAIKLLDITYFNDMGNS